MSLAEQKMFFIMRVSNYPRAGMRSGSFTVYEAVSKDTYFTIEENARTEAIRLANLHPGVRFYVCGTNEGFVSSPPPPPANTIQSKRY